MSLMSRGSLCRYERVLRSKREAWGVGLPPFSILRGEVDAVLAALLAAVLSFPGEGAREMDRRTERMSVSFWMCLGDEESLMYPSLSKRTRHCIPLKVYLMMRWWDTEFPKSPQVV